VAQWPVSEPAVEWIPDDSLAPATSTHGPTSLVVGSIFSQPASVDLPATSTTARMSSPGLVRAMVGDLFYRRFDRPGAYAASPAAEGVERWDEPPTDLVPWRRLRRRTGVDGDARPPVSDAEMALGKSLMAERLDSAFPSVPTPGAD
jgi:hypothetical protein